MCAGSAESRSTEREAFAERSPPIVFRIFAGTGSVSAANPVRNQK